MPSCSGLYLVANTIGEVVQSAVDWCVWMRDGLFENDTAAMVSLI